MDLELNDQVALITGAGSPVGFGKGIALVLAKEGCDIIVNDIRGDDAEKTADEVRSLGRKAIAVKADVTKVQEVKNMVDAGLKEFGKIDILVNNAGRASAPRPFVETSDEDIERVMNLNVFGTFHVTKAVLPGMIKRESGKIINIASGAGLTGMPRCLAYGSSKAAVMAFTKGLQKEVAPLGIRVNAIAPGLGDTNFLSAADFPEGEIERALPMIPSGKPTTPDDIGQMTAFLASARANNVLGQLYIVDGGMCMR